MNREFIASSLFDIKKGKRLTKANMTAGDINFIGSTAANNGVTAKIGNTDCLHPPHTITVSYNGSVGEVFLQTKPFWASDDVNVWYPRFQADDCALLYIVTIIKKLGVKYSYSNKWTIDRMRNEVLALPVVESSDSAHDYTVDDIDFQYMRDRIAELERDRIAELDAYLKVTGLDDYELTDEDKAVLSLPSKDSYYKAGSVATYAEDGRVRFKRFSLGELFTAATGDVDLQQKDINGKGEFFINSGVSNCGIKGRTDRAAKVFSANTITIDFWGNAYYRDFEYKMATHNHVFSLSGEVIRNKEVGLYLVALLCKLPLFFSYDDMATWNKLKSVQIALPMTADDEIDFVYMEHYIRAMEKQAIADVVRYRDSVIAATKRAVAHCRDDGIGFDRLLT